ncbi:ABC transporter permease [Pseudonocardia alni]|uniref:ABC transporter permease n=1 Tax=Pseudonocardia alni TaxID=33907 RepID=UPI0033CE1A5C
MSAPSTLGSRFGAFALRAFCVVAGLLLVAPTLVVIPLSFTDRQSFAFPPTGWSTRWYENFFDDRSWYTSALLSLQVGAVVALLATALGTAAAIALVMGGGRWRIPARGFLLTPAILPGVIVAIAIFAVFLQWGLTQTTTGYVLAHTVLALPLVVIAVTASLSTFDRQLIRAAHSLGAGAVATFVHVTLPLIAPGVLTGALFAFLTSFDEAIVSLFLSGPFARTLPIQIYQSVTAEIDPTIAAASTMLIVLTTVALVAVGLITTLRNRGTHA